MTIGKVYKPQSTASAIMIVDDHPLYSDALASAVRLHFADCNMKQVGTLRECLGDLDEGFEPDLVMFDLKLPDVKGISGFVSLRGRLPDTPILVISSLASVELVHSLIQEGAAGFFPKDAPAEHLKKALTEILAGRKYVPDGYKSVDGRRAKHPQSPFGQSNLSRLTPQQQRIMKLICAGKPNKQIAYELALAEATVKAHITALFRRLGASNRTEAVALLDTSGQGDPLGDGEVSAFLKH